MYCLVQPLLQSQRTRQNAISNNTLEHTQLDSHGKDTEMKPAKSTAVKAKKPMSSSAVTKAGRAAKISAYQERMPGAST